MSAPFPSPTGKWHSDTYPSLSPKRPELSAKGKNVIITGGGSGIGAETARRFAEAGASRIALLGRREQPLLDTKASIQKEIPNVEIVVASADVMEQADVESAFTSFLGNSGKIDILISGAAMTGPMDPVRSVDPDKFVDNIDKNLRGALNVAQAFIRHAAPNAVVVEINSSAAHVNFGAGFASYSVAKLGVFRIWDSLAFAYPELSIFHIQPGVVNTDMNREAGGVDALGFEDHVSLPATFSVWLASPEARFLKGKFLWANWDVDELKARAEEIRNNHTFDVGLVGWPFGQEGWKFQISASADANSAFNAK